MVLYRMNYGIIHDELWYYTGLKMILYRINYGIIED